jgi:hypothetical protein
MALPFRREEQSDSLSLCFYRGVTAGCHSHSLTHSSRLWMSTQRVRFTLRLAVGQSVSLGVEAHLGLMTRYLLLFHSYGIVFCGAPSLTRGRVCLLYTLLALASAVFLGSKSLRSRDHILLSQFWDFLFVASYNSQGHGGGIRPRLHTGHLVLSLYNYGTDRTENTASKNSSIVACLFFAAEIFFPLRYLAMAATIH